MKILINGVSVGKEETLGSVRKAKTGDIALCLPGKGKPSRFLRFDPDYDL